MMSDLGYTWPGLPVTCGLCLQSGVPAYEVTDKRCGFVMPEHDWYDDANNGGPCPNSGAAVDRAVSATMAARIEEHVVSAMPPAHTPSDPPMRGIQD